MLPPATEIPVISIGSTSRVRGLRMATDLDALVLKWLSLSSNNNSSRYFLSRRDFYLQLFTCGCVFKFLSFLLWCNGVCCFWWPPPRSPKKFSGSKEVFAVLPKNWLDYYCCWWVALRVVCGFTFMLPKSNYLGIVDVGVTFSFICLVELQLLCTDKLRRKRPVLDLLKLIWIFDLLLFWFEK